MFRYQAVSSRWLRRGRTRKWLNYCDPVTTRHRFRLELGLKDEIAAEVFAEVVFLCDGLLEYKADEVGVDAKRTRFFKIASQLPLQSRTRLSKELQMVLCNRVADSPASNIRVQMSELAFRSLAAAYL